MDTVGSVFQTDRFSGKVDPWAEAVSGSQLLNDPSCILTKHVVLGDSSVVAVSLWVLLSYLTEIVDTLAILAITSPEKRCGKTKLLNVLHHMVHKPLASVSISPAALYRVIEKYCPTLLVDEADTFLKNNDELRGVINGGHTRTQAFVLRANREDGEIEQFSIWAPKAIELIGKLHPTLYDRSLVIKMVRRTREESITQLRNTPKEKFDKIRSQIVRWVADNAQGIAAAKPDVPSSLNDQAAENWLPLLAIAEAAGGRWPALARQAAISLNVTDNDEDSVITTLLAALRRAFQEARQANEDDDFHSTGDILKSLNADREAPWADWRSGNGISDEKLARMLKPFGTKSAQVQKDDKRARGYLFGSLKPIFERYLPPESLAL